MEEEEQQQLSIEMRMPTVIDDEMLTKAVYEQGPQEYAGKIAREEGIDFVVVKKLRLDYRNILQIDNLWCFTSLVRLQLDNNLIEKIENLDDLVNLTWLDLSFNNIEKIEGLSSLVKLEDLILFNNRIEIINNIDSLKQLQVLSIGNNSIRDLESLIYLRRFKSLKTLNLLGNPICELDDYSPYITGLLKNLVYFDHFLVDQATREKGQEKFDISLQKLDEDDAIEETAARIDAQEAEHFNYASEAFVENLDHGKFFDLLYEGEDDVLKLDILEMVASVRQTFRDKVSAECQRIYDYGVERYEERKVELRQVRACIDDAISTSRQHGTTLVNQFNDYKTELWTQMAESMDADSVYVELAEFVKKLDELKETLIDREMLLVDQLEEIVRDLELNVRDEMSHLVEFAHGQLAICRDLENVNHEILMELVEKIANKSLSPEQFELIGGLVAEKEFLISMLTSSHDLHLLRVDTREDALVRRSGDWVTALIDDLHDHVEMRRNRERVTEICHFVDRLREEVDEIEDQVVIQPVISEEFLDIDAGNVQRIETATVESELATLSEKSSEP